ncbi:putative HVA22-like protein g [Diplonema papillatum]|nr:putative HVA22-like protein g [Diplonema papillatum]
MASAFLVSTLMVGASYVYPAYCTAQALSGDSKTQKPGRWMAYWALQGLLTFFFDTPIGLMLIWMLDPFVSLARIALAVYLFLPSTEGSALVVDKIQPHWNQHKGHVMTVIDTCVSMLRAAEKLAKNIEAVPIPHAESDKLY